MKQQLQQAILATFRDDKVADVAITLKRFTVREWQQSYRWLDASGLAIYFLNRMESTGLAHCLPEPVISRLAVNRDDHRAQLADQFAEFTRINHAFQSAALRYAALKGFSLIPGYCPDPLLRYQLDFDFLVHPADASRCVKELSSLGYQLTRTENSEWQFKAGTGRIPPANDIYKPKQQRSLELHFGVGHPNPSDASDRDLLSRHREQTLHELSFPSLCPADMFLTQALHLFGHINSEWTRVSWLLEFRHFVLSNADNESLWEEVRTRAVHFEDSAVAIGTATLLASMAFGNFTSPALNQWAIGALSDPVRLWIDHYGWNLIFAEFPGTKLYLFLRRELVNDERAWKRFRRAKIVPLHLPVNVVRFKNATQGPRFDACWNQSNFFISRLGFHLIEAVRHSIESLRWKRVRSYIAHLPLE